MDIAGVIACYGVTFHCLGFFRYLGQRPCRNHLFLTLVNRNRIAAPCIFLPVLLIFDNSSVPGIPAMQCQELTLLFQEAIHKSAGAELSRPGPRSQTRKTPPGLRGVSPLRLPFFLRLGDGNRGAVAVNRIVIGIIMVGRFRIRNSRAGEAIDRKSQATVFGSL